jgi:type IV pilus assembly protein PilM
MQILPTSLRLMGTGLRPRLACEVRPSSIVAARSEDSTGAISAVSGATLPAGALVPGLRSGNIADRSNFISALQRALDPLSSRANDLTLIVPDSAARVLLLDFDSLPSRVAEALPVVRFRLKKLLSFEADTAAVSYQVMSSEKNLVRVVAAAMPREVLDEYELAVRDAGYEPGAILPSTLASLTLLAARDAASGEAAQASLIVNANQYCVTTAIVRSGILLLHRTLDFTVEVPTLAEVRSEENATEQPPAPAVPVFASNLDPAPPVVTAYVEPLPEWEIGQPHADTFDDSPIEAAAAMQTDQLRQEIEREALAAAHAADQATDQTVTAEVAQAVSVAAAYFEDTLNTAPTQILSSGSIDAKELEAILTEAGFGDALVHVRELVPASLLLADAASASAPRSLLAGVAGALATGDAQA